MCSPDSVVVLDGWAPELPGRIERQNVLCFLGKVGVL